MKLHLSRPEKIIRINIRQSGESAIHLAFEQCDLMECSDKLLSAIYNNLSDFSDDHSKKTTIQCREWENSKNGKSSSFTFYGPKSSIVRDFIVSHFDK